MQTYEQYAGYETRDGDDDGSAECSFCERHVEWSEWTGSESDPVCWDCRELYWCDDCREYSTRDEFCVHVARKVSILTPNEREERKVVA